MRISILVDTHRHPEIHTALREFEVPYMGFDKRADDKLAMVFDVSLDVIDQIRMTIDGIGILEGGLWSRSPAMMEPCASSS